MERIDAMKIWHDCYAEVNRLGKQISSYYKTKTRISEEEKVFIQGVEDKIRGLHLKSNVALDAAGLKPNRPLWVYNNDDTSTWPSHKDFAFATKLPKTLVA